MHQWTKSDTRDIRNFGTVEPQKEKVRIDVFTSEYCSFCKDALLAAHSAAKSASLYTDGIEVRETSVDERPELIEALNLVALPLIQVGREQIVGLPNEEDIERLIQTKLLMG